MRERLETETVWLVYRYGYDDRALMAQTLLAWLVLPATLWLALMYPLLVYLPTHWLLGRSFGE